MCTAVSWTPEDFDQHTRWRLPVTVRSAFFKRKEQYPPIRAAHRMEAALSLPIASSVTRSLTQNSIFFRTGDRPCDVMWRRLALVVMASPFRCIRSSSSIIPCRFSREQFDRRCCDPPTHPPCALAQDLAGVQMFVGSQSTQNRAAWTVMRIRAPQLICKRRESRSAHGIRILLVRLHPSQ